MSILIALICFAATGITIYRYLASTFRLLEDVKAFLVHTAKDSDQPSRCE